MLSPEHPADRAAVDVDVPVIGSGLGGSAAALRLAEKGWSVRRPEVGRRRFADADFAKTSWDVKNYLWAPGLGCYGVQRIHKPPDVMILAGAGVGGGSLNYANTFTDRRAFYEDPQWRDLADWGGRARPHYDTASRMLGVVDENPCDGPVEQVMKRATRGPGRRRDLSQDSCRGLLRHPGVTVPDPYFGGGPGTHRLHHVRQLHGRLPRRGQEHPRQELLALAEGLGVHIEPMRTVTTRGDPGPAGPTGARHTESGTRRPTREGERNARVTRARFVVVAGGTWGTQSLLHAMKESGDLPHLSDRLGHHADQLRGTAGRAHRGPACRGRPHARHRDHVEFPSRRGHPTSKTSVMAGAAMRWACSRPFWFLATPTTRRPVEFLRTVRRHPQALTRMFPMVRAWSERIVIGLVMQSRDNSLRVFRRHGRLTSEQGHGEPNPTYIAAGHRAMEAVARASPRRPGSTRWRAARGRGLRRATDGAFPGAVRRSEGTRARESSTSGTASRPPGISITDGSTISANLGVNPSLTITAQAERAMALWPRKGSGIHARPTYP